MATANFILGITGSIILVVGSAWSEGRKNLAPVKSIKNWLLALGAASMFTYAVINHITADGPIFFAFLQGLAIIASIMMMLNIDDKVDTAVITISGLALIIWSLYLFEGFNTINFILGLTGIGLGYAFKNGTIRRAAALTLGSALIALFSYMEQSWIFFWLNFFFAIFSAYYLAAAWTKNNLKN